MVNKWDLFALQRKVGLTLKSSSVLFNGLIKMVFTPEELATRKATGSRVGKHPPLDQEKCNLIRGKTDYISC